MKTTQTNRPYPLYVVEEREGAKPFWTQIGSAFPHKSGRGFNIKLKALPITGELVMLEPKADTEVGQ